jgi:hypothetical protein
MLKILETKNHNLLSISDVKSFLRISHSTDDSLIERQMAAAISFAEKYIGTHIIHKVIEEKFEDCQKIILSEKPLIKIEEVSCLYEIKRNEIILDKKYKEVKVRYLVGAEDISPCLIEAILNHICLLYDKRGDPNMFSYQAKSFYRDFKEIKI